MAKRTSKYNRDRNKQLNSKGDNLRNQLKAGQAVDLINDLITGKLAECSRQRLTAARIALNKCLPDLQAVGILIEDNRGKTKDDIDAMLMAAGLKPALEYTNSTSHVPTMVDTDTIGDIPAKSLISHKSSE